MALSGSYGIVHPHGWNRARVQLGGGVVFGTFVPFAIALLFSPRLLELSSFQDTFVAALFATLVGYHFFKSLTAFPGIRASYYILPAFSSAYVASVLILFLARLNYSRPLLVMSYVICVAWYYLVYFRVQKRTKLLIGVVPVGDVNTLHDIDNVTWERLDTPRNHPRHYSAIVADFHAEMPDHWETYLADAALSGIRVLHVRQLRESLTGRVEIRHLSENANGSLVPQAAYFRPKFVVDVVAAGLALVVLSPLLAVVGFVIKATSQGPVLFHQQRIGYRGNAFRVWKFRTMTDRRAAASIADIAEQGRAEQGRAEQGRLDAITQDNDPRITPIGRFLRRTRIDELPQLLNVAAGQMSFIGPRPEAAVLAQWYQQEIPFYRYRHIVRPGITGWAQVNQGHVADVDGVNHKLHYDFYYISHFSLWLDILIVIRTIRTIVTGFGSK